MTDEFKRPDGSEYFGRRPPESEKAIGLPVLRAKQRGSLGGLVLSELCLGTWTHFFQGRTRACTGPGCRICAADHARRWHGWVVVQDSRSGKLAILELPANAALDLDDHAREYGSLRGYSMSIERPSGKVNGRVRLTISATKVPELSLKPCPDLRGLLLRMWQVRGDDSVIDIFDEPKMYDGEEDGDCGIIA